MAQSRSGNHAKSYLDTLFTTSTRNASTLLLTPTFKPHTPSSLSSSASASASEDGAAEASAVRALSADDSDSDGSGSLLATSPSFSSSFKSAQLSMQTLSQYTTPASASSSRRTSTSAATVADSSSEVLAILNNDSLDEDDRIDRVHSTLAASLLAIEGVPSPSSRIDGLVLDLMHRHREDKFPTGATFSPAQLQSPSRRPASIRSTSSRPWTPSRPPFVSSSSSFGTAADANAFLSTPQQPSSPLVSSTPTAALTAASPRQHPGVIGSSSPRASPRPWNRTLSSLSVTSLASPSTSAAVTSPGGAMGTNSSRPSSPSSFGSPRLNFAATEFKPRNASSTSLVSASLTPTRPMPLLTRQSSSIGSLALANKTHSTAEDDEEDEFSPFASVKPPPESYRYDGGDMSGVPIPWPGSTWPSADATDDPAGDSAASMTPFDMLYSILTTGTKAGSPEWSPEQVDEALVLHNYDIEKTLTAIWENEGRPLGDGTRSSMAGYIARTAAGQVATSPHFTPATATIRAGVNILPREALTLRTSGRAPTTKGGASAQPAAQAASSQGSNGASRVCRYYLAGECRRSDCKFSHDLENRTVCRYWLKGQCAHDPCNFLHDYDALNQLAAGITTGLQVEDGATWQDADATTPVRDEFPELGRAGKGSYAAATLAGSNEGKAKWTASQRAPTDATAKDAGGIHSKAGPARSGTVTSKAGKTARAAVSSRLTLRAPLLLPSLSTSKQAAATYAAHRGDTTTLAERRNKALARAADAFGRNDVSAARKLSQEASSINSQYEDETHAASRDLLLSRMADLANRAREDNNPHVSDEIGVRSRRGQAAGAGLGIHLGTVRRSSLPSNSSASVEERAEALVDLHALHAHEAVEHAQAFLLALESESFGGLALLAFKESHITRSTSQRRAHLAGALKQFLASYLYPFAECDGVLVVDHLTHS